jgi:hypothetical protein
VFDENGLIKNQFVDGTQMQFNFDDVSVLHAVGNNCSEIVSIACVRRNCLLHNDMLILHGIIFVIVS